MSLRTPLLRGKSLLKLEYKQPSGSYKMRGLRELFPDPAQIPKRISVLSAGNMARSLLMLCQNHSEITVYVPDSIPEAKESFLRSCRCTLRKIPMAELWKMVELGARSVPDGEFLVHPIDRPELLRGYSRMVDEIVAEAPALSELCIPFGVGGLFIGVSRRLRELRPMAKIVAVESACKHPLYSAFHSIPDPQTRSWVDAIGTPRVLSRTLSILQNEKLIDEIRLVDPQEAKARAIVYYLETTDKIEGAAALSLVASEQGGANSVAILSGSNVNPEIFSALSTREEFSHRLERA